MFFCHYFSIFFQNTYICVFIKNFIISFFLNNYFNKKNVYKYLIFRFLQKI